MKPKSYFISKKKEFQDEAVAAFYASRKYVEKQAEYGAGAYIKCLGDVERELQAKGVKMKRSFSSSSAHTSS